MEFPEYNAEQLDKAVQKKADEIFNMFKSAIQDQITDAVTNVSPNLLNELSKSCALAHIKPFKEPLVNMPTDSLNGAALERLQLVKEFWNGVEIHLNSM